MGGRADAAAARSHRYLPLVEAASDGAGVHLESLGDRDPGLAYLVTVALPLLILGLSIRALSHLLDLSAIRTRLTVQDSTEDDDVED